MKVIDILLNKIDELNSRIKNEDEMTNKLHLVFQIEKIIEIIRSVEALRIQSGDKEPI